MDKAAFEEQYRLVYRDIYRFALYTLGIPEDAEDVVSEAVMDAYKEKELLKKQGSFKSWIFKILTAKCKRKLKEYVNKTKELDMDLMASEESGHWNIEESQDVKNAFWTLNGQERLIVSMSVFGGYNSREIGHSLFLNDATVRSKLSRALGKMKKLLEA